jgi:crotonobetainyl-CoA:carnitine CoA-transferase CaiB-like acyl-CoA transferase
LFNDPKLTSNNDRVQAREWLLPILRERLQNFSAQELSEVFENNSLPYAPITAPHELLDDPHLHATGGLAPMTLNDGRSIHTVLLPLSMDQERLKVRQPPPHLGEHNESLLKSLGYTPEEIQKLSPPT